MFTNLFREMFSKIVIFFEKPPLKAHNYNALVLFTIGGVRFFCLTTEAD